MKDMNAMRYQPCSKLETIADIAKLTFIGAIASAVILNASSFEILKKFTIGNHMFHADIEGVEQDQVDFVDSANSSELLDGKAHNNAMSIKKGTLRLILLKDSVKSHWNFSSHGIVTHETYNNLLKRITGKKGGSR